MAINPLLVALVLGAAQDQPAAPVPAPPPAPSAPAFSISVDPAILPRVNEVLREVSQPVVTRIPTGSEARPFLDQICGGRESPEILAIRSGGGEAQSLVRHAPCARVGQGRDILIRHDTTLKEMAEAEGMVTLRARMAELRDRVEGSATRRMTGDTLRAGNVVRFLQTPEWTEITLDTAVAPDRAALIDALARALNCEGPEPEQCLNNHGLLVLNRSVSPAPPAPTPDRPVADATPPPQIVVPPDQWPYDALLLAAVLDDAGPSVSSVTIGVADGGLGNRSGFPIPAAAFQRNADEGDASDGLDNNGDTFFDDLHGSGILRPPELARAGDLGICPSDNVDFSALGPLRGAADHGSIVASIATGLPLRGTVRNAASLPRLVFFRLVGDLCAPAAVADVSEAALRDALQYLFRSRRADILVLSYTHIGETSQSFEEAASRFFTANSNNLLILPAGNDRPGNLDTERPCPACLGNLKFDAATAPFTIVVGAADRTLRIADFSNWGRDTVFIYAPSETHGALDVTGTQATAYGPATSWAAPYAGFAAGLMRSLGMTNARDVRERLLAATWPIDAIDGRVDSSRTGVLNLMMAAAVRRTSIAVLRPGSDGQRQIRTYVGSLATPLAELCPERDLALGGTHAIRFGALAGNLRQLTLQSRTFDETRRLYPSASAQCSMPARIMFNDLVAGPQEFDSTDVVRILLPWIVPA